MAVYPTGRLVHAARVLLKWKQRELAASADVAIGTVVRMESHDEGIDAHAHIDTAGRVRDTLEREGIEFICEELAIGVRLIKRRTRRALWGD